MGLSVAERELLRKRVKNFIEKNKQMKNVEIVNHFVLEGIARRTVYSVINKLRTPCPILEKKRTGRPSSWNGEKRKRLKRLTNNRCDVSQNKLTAKFDVHQTTICR
jgi:transposase